jgi:mono/diheme cytochrome c family protein
MRTLLAFLVGVLGTLIVVASGTYLVLYLGWFPIGADNQPGTIERRLSRVARHGYMAKYVPQRENTIQPTAANLIEGARAYEQYCAVCHGGAGRSTSVLRTKFSPPVPQLVTRVPHDADVQLWWVTKHGIRMTGMPAWDGILSDDQIWKIVTFLKHSNKLPPEAKAAWQMAAATPVTAEKQR